MSPLQSRSELAPIVNEIWFNESQHLFGDENRALSGRR
jgi:hypothetical protein